MSRGKFFTFEGPEGCGKSTQIGLLERRLRDMGYDVVVTREPGGTPTGEKIRDILQHDLTKEAIHPRSEVLLFEASRAQLVEHVILPALARGACVICDRFMDSTTAYQGYGRGFSIETISLINQFAVGEAVPDATLLLDLPVDEGFERIAKRNPDHTALDRIEREDRSFHEKVRAGYLQMAEEEPERFHLVETSKPIEEVSKAIWKIIEDVLKR